MKQFLEKESQIPSIQSIVNKITKMLDDAEAAKKKCEQINKLKSEIKKETDSSISMTKKEILQLLEKLNKEKWIIGEYKWMPIGSSMPEGWFKVALAKGHTLVQGDELGLKLTTGMVKSHNHFYSDKKELASIYKIDESNGNPKVFFHHIKPSNDIDYGVGLRNKEDVMFTTRTASSGETLIENNLAAGLYSELWQYKGIDYKKKSLNSCIHGYVSRYISQLISKLETCKKDQMGLELLQPEEQHRDNCC